MFFQIYGSCILHNHISVFLHKKSKIILYIHRSGGMLSQNQTDNKISQGFYFKTKEFWVIKISHKFHISNDNGNLVKHKIYLSNYIRKYCSVFANEMWCYCIHWEPKWRYNILITKRLLVKWLYALNCNKN